MTVRRVVAGRLGPAGAETRTSLAFLCSSVACELRDIRGAIERWSVSEGKPVPIAGVPSRVWLHLDNAFDLLERIQQEHCADDVVRERLVNDTEPTLSSERQQREPGE